MTFQADNHGDAGFGHSQPPPAGPGWYAINPNQQQFWDGAQWVGGPQPGQPYVQQPQQLITGSTSEERTLALFVHLMFFVVGGIGPFIVYLIKKDESEFVRHHAAEALNFILTGLAFIAAAWVAAFVFLVLSSVSYVFSVVAAVFFFVGYLGFFGIMLIGVVLSIIAAVAANKGEWYRYPLIWHLVK